MSYSVKIIADSINPVGCRLTTFELTFPKCLQAEFNTHRLFSRNSASSRAIPVEKMIERVMTNPMMPLYWGKNQKGMQAAEELTGGDREMAEFLWLQARDKAVASARAFIECNAHKQLVNRLLEPWMFTTVIVSATEYDNWFHLRDSEFAQPEIAWVAREMRKKYDENIPQHLDPGEWHMPFIDWDDEVASPIKNQHGDVVGGMEITTRGLRKISVARCARVSYLTHDGKRDFVEDYRLHDQLVQNGHWSPFEHVAECLPNDERSGNFFGWRQYRKSFETEHYGKKMP